MEKLKEGEVQTLDCIRAFQLEHGYSPTLRELGAIMRVSPTLAALRVASLCVKGRLRRTPNLARSLVIVETP